MWVEKASSFHLHLETQGNAFVRADAAFDDEKKHWNIFWLLWYLMHLQTPKLQTGLWLSEHLST